MNTGAAALFRPDAGGSASRAFSRYSWFLLAYLLAVILFGAWVRVTGSGAGCGSHWPTCHGEVLPRNPGAATTIEFTHRITSAVLGLFVIALLLWALVSFRHYRPVIVAASVTFAFTLIETAIGARLVLSELVGSNASVARAIVICIHLVSTFSLTAATALCAWWSTRTPTLCFETAPRAKWALLGCAAAVALISMTGAVTALGDTLFPVSPTDSEGLISRMRADLDPTSHFLVRLRVVHPVLAVILSGALVALPTYIASAVNQTTGRLLNALRLAVLAQLLVGVANISLGAPGAVQLVHLLLAQAVWLLLVLSLVASMEVSPGDAGSTKVRDAVA